MKRTEHSYLYEQLEQYKYKDIYPFHMPGHKRQAGFIDFSDAVSTDITEIEGFDNLHHACGVISNAQKRAARLYGAEETHFLVNGSSAGILAAVLGSVNQGKRLLMARNCHKSVYHAVLLGRLEPIYIYPHLNQKYGIYESIDPNAVRQFLEHNKDIGAVIITSPTYEGVVSDIASISELVHSYGIPLIVDEAHGAHFGFCKAFPESAVRLGADIVIQSVHKTLPSLTQTALLHINGSIVNRASVAMYLNILQTSSPSYLLMSSIDQCMALLEERGKELFDSYVCNLSQFYEKVGKLDKICLLRGTKWAEVGVYEYDMSKIVIFTEPVSACGKSFYDILLNIYKIQMEMVSRDYVLGMTSLCDTQEGFERLYEALDGLNEADMGSFKKYGRSRWPACRSPKVSLYEAVCAKAEAAAFTEASGRISADFAYIYPPGVPFLTPGEEITDEHLELMRNQRAEGLSIEGVADTALNTLRVLREKSM